jgi:hypothetical protein
MNFSSMMKSSDMNATHMLIIALLIIIIIILSICVARAAKKSAEQFSGTFTSLENFRHVSANSPTGLMAESGTFNLSYSPSENFRYGVGTDQSGLMAESTTENFVAGTPGQGAANLMATTENFAPSIDAKAIKSHLRMKNRIFY